MTATLQFCEAAPTLAHVGMALASEERAAGIRHPVNYARALLVEEIMALVGRSVPDPVSFRAGLERMPLEQLRAKRDALLDGI